MVSLTRFLVIIDAPLTFFSVANHTAFYLESEVKQALCDDECRAAASQLEKAILDQARSNTGYKAQIIARRKDIESDTHCSSLHTSFHAQKAVEVAEKSARQATSRGFVKASELLGQAPIMPDSESEEEEKPKKIKVEKLSTKDRLKRLRDKKQARVSIFFFSFYSNNTKV